MPKPEPIKPIEDIEADCLRGRISPGDIIKFFLIPKGFQLGVYRQIHEGCPIFANTYGEDSANPGVRIHAFSARGQNPFSSYQVIERAPAQSSAPTTRLFSGDTGASDYPGPWDNLNEQIHP